MRPMMDLFPSGLIPRTANTSFCMQLEDGYFIQDVKVVARSLLGKILCTRNKDGGITRSVILETEAYDGEDDLACHASKGKTPRTEVMYRKGGVCYVYLCYGIHWMLNVVTGEEGYPAAVLIRGVSNFSGPGRLTKGLRLNGSLNGKILCPQSSIWIEDSHDRAGQVLSGPRIGVDYAGPIWRKKPYRFWFSKAKVMK